MVKLFAQLALVDCLFIGVAKQRYAETVDALRRDGDHGGRVLLQRLRSSCTRVQLARRFHNDAVVDVQRVRRKRLVRTFRLAGHAELPHTVEFDDRLPSALE